MLSLKEFNLLSPTLFPLYLTYMERRAGTGRPCGTDMCHRHKRGHCFIELGQLTPNTGRESKHGRVSRGGSSSQAPGMGSVF